jgi:GGDEF domain-containing protein
VSGQAHWLAEQPYDEVAGALRYAARQADQAEYLARAGGDEHLALWLRLVEHHAETAAQEAFRAPRIAANRFPWRAAYEAGWSPNRAAQAAQYGMRAKDRQQLQAAVAAQQSEMPGTQTNASRRGAEPPLAGL